MTNKRRVLHDFVGRGNSVMPSSHRRQGRQIFWGQENEPTGQSWILHWNGIECAVRRCILCCSLLIILSLL